MAKASSMLRTGRMPMARTSPGTVAPTTKIYDVRCSPISAMDSMEKPWDGW
jgi:hypothetical protein